MGHKKQAAPLGEQSLIVEGIVGEALDALLRLAFVRGQVTTAQDALNVFSSVPSDTPPGDILVSLIAQLQSVEAEARTEMALLGAQVAALEKRA